MEAVCEVLERKEHEETDVMEGERWTRAGCCTEQPCQAEGLRHRQAAWQSDRKRKKRRQQKNPVVLLDPLNQPCPANHLLTQETQSQRKASISPKPMKNTVSPSCSSSGCSCSQHHKISLIICTNIEETKSNPEGGIPSADVEKEGLVQKQGVVLGAPYCK